MCWYASLWRSTAATCCPPLCANAPWPTKGCCSGSARLAISATVRDSSLNLSTEVCGSASNPSFSTRLDTTETRFALPHRSPYPLMVPCTISAPAITPASELATASSQSLCVWMPTRVWLPMPASALRTASTPCSIAAGWLPPLVSQSTTHDAPARAAERHTSIAYSASRA